MTLADSSFARELREDEKREWKISKLTHSTLSLAVREVTRTPDLPLRRRSLYPTELRRQGAGTRINTGFPAFGHGAGLWSRLIFWSAVDDCDFPGCLLVVFYFEKQLSCNLLRFLDSIRTGF